MTLRKSMLIELNDNVAVAVEPIEAGQGTKVHDEVINANEFIKEGHKIARVDIAKGEEIVKYGVHVGVTTADIKKGDWVHEHNVYDDFEEINRERRAYYRSMSPTDMDYTIKSYYDKDELDLPETVMGYKRKVGAFGIRNNVVVISLVQCSNNAALQIANACDVAGTYVDAACGEFPDRFARTYRGFITAATHPNTYGAVILSLGCQQTNPDDVVRDIEKTGRPVVSISLQSDGGVGKAIEDGIAAVNKLKEEAAAQERVPCPTNELVICGYNGGSDWTSGLSANPVVGDVIDMHSSLGAPILHVVGRGGYPERAGSYELGMELMKIGDFFEEDSTRRAGKGLSQVNPTPGNKEGGLTTMTEKNLGSFMTLGRGKLKGLLDVGEFPTEGGEWGINQAQGANDAYATTSYAMGGAHICLFTTGRGNPIGNAAMTTIKITGNPRTADSLSDMIDFSAKPVLYGEQTLHESAKELYKLMIEVANGKITKSEMLKDHSWLTPHGTSYNGDY